MDFTVTGAAILLLQPFIKFALTPDASFTTRILASLFGPGVFPYSEGKLFFVAYPPIPWLAIMLIGFAAGSLFTRTATIQRKLFLRAGLVSLCAFVLIRLMNNYGDPVKWAVQKNSTFNFLSFINVSKYPPSLLFCLLFLGIMLVILSAVQSIRNRWTSIVNVYGKVPMFYFLVHWYIIHPLVFLMVYLQGYQKKELVFGANFGRPKSGSGLDLWAVFLVWTGIVLLMYPLCKWFGAYKQKHHEKWWLRYL